MNSWIRLSGGVLMRVVVYTHLSGLMASAFASFADRHGMHGTLAIAMTYWGLITLIACPIGEILLAQSSRFIPNRVALLAVLIIGLEFAQCIVILPAIQ